jgi:protoporphyrinogen oxidase
MQKKAVIIGAGPAGLTAAYELLKRTDIKPVILEKSGDIGGISKTVNYKGNRIDIGGHRFFSKSDRVMEWWLDKMPLEMEADEMEISYQNKRRRIAGDPMANGQTGDPDKVMLVRHRLSRIYFLRKFFSYPVRLSIDSLKKLGLARTMGILFSYAKARLFPRRQEKNLEDFLINRFGVNLYRLFFKDYTEKVWGVPCTKISAEWGAQRIKGISVAKALSHALKSMRPRSRNSNQGISQKDTETSLIEKFLYPKYGPGQLWEEVARQVVQMGGEIHFHQDVKRINTREDLIYSVEALNGSDGIVNTYMSEYCFSTMPVKELIEAMNGGVPEDVKKIAGGLQYRDFITVGVLLSKMPSNEMLPDTWIYIQERDVKVGRLQIFNNWSPFMVKDKNTIWVGMEYFCNMTDDFWKLSEAEIQRIAIEELEKMGLANAEDVLDATVIRVEKTYPAYFGTYDRFDEIRRFTDGFQNLFLVGRNGMHKYNNSDHSMLTAMVAVDNIKAGIVEKANIWSINTEQEYHEEKATPQIDPKAAEEGFRVSNPLWNYLWRTPANRAWWFSALFVWLVQIVWFKIRYPFANYMPDSYSYLDAAATNADVNMWPVAYSKFLRLVSVFSHSDKAVVSIQYLFMQASGLVFLFTLFYFLKPSKIVRNILLVFFLFNPAILYLSNYISADSLFLGCSFLWMASLLWVVFEPKPWQVLVQAILLLACFTLRYNAIYYPIIALCAFLLSRYPWYGKMAGVAVCIVFVGFSFSFTSSKMKELTGHAQFSAFGGWQMANNALYMYQNIPARDRGTVPARFAKLEAMVRQHMDTLARVKLTKEDTVSARFYLWSPNGPLIQYLLRETKKDSTTPYFKRWAAMAPLYMDYGSYLIRKYPATFARSVLLPNALRFAVPPVEFLGIYNMGGDSVGVLAKAWFNYKSQRVSEHNSRNNRIHLMEWYSTLGTLINSFFLICLVGMLIFNGYRASNKALLNVLMLVILTWLLNSGFSIVASPIVLRYQLFAILISLAMSTVLIQHIYFLAKQEDLNNKKLQL